MIERKVSHNKYNIKWTRPDEQDVSQWVSVAHVTKHNSAQREMEKADGHNYKKTYRALLSSQRVTDRNTTFP